VSTLDVFLCELELWGEIVLFYVRFGFFENINLAILGFTVHNLFAIADRITFIFMNYGRQ